MRMLPPPSLPVAMGHSPAARAAAAPPLEPPGVWAMFHGLRHGSPIMCSVVPRWPNSGVLVLPMMMPPAAFTRSTMMSSSSGTSSLNMREPRVVADALGRVEVLDGHGQAVERADRVAAGQGCFGVAGLGHGLVAADGEEGVELPVERLDAAEEELRHLHGGEVTLADALRQFPGGGEGQLSVTHVFLLGCGVGGIIPRGPRGV